MKRRTLSAFLLIVALVVAACGGGDTNKPKVLAAFDSLRNSRSITLLASVSGQLPLAVSGQVGMLNLSGVITTAMIDRTAHQTSVSLTVPQMSFLNSEWRVLNNKFYTSTLNTDGSITWKNTAAPTTVGSLGWTMANIDQTTQALVAWLNRTDVIVGTLPATTCGSRTCDQYTLVSPSTTMQGVGLLMPFLTGPILAASSQTITVYIDQQTGHLARATATLKLDVTHGLTFYLSFGQSDTPLNLVVPTNQPAPSAVPSPKP